MSACAAQDSARGGVLRDASGFQAKLDSQLDERWPGGLIGQHVMCNAPVVPTSLRTASAADVAKLANSLRALSESRRRLLGLDAAPADLNASPKLYAVRDVSPDCPAWDRPWQEADA